MVSLRRTGIHLPYGAHVVVPTYGIHNGENNYENPAVFDALRYIKQKDISHPTKEYRHNDHIKKANLSIVTSSPSYHLCHFGKHACPGRFFAPNELKLLLAYVVLNYDIESLVERPRGRWVPHLDCLLRGP